MLGLIMDGIVALLLIATIAFAIRLNSRLGALKNDREGIERMIMSLQTASRQAEEAIAGLKEAALENGQRLQSLTERAERLRADMEFMIDRGETIADRLEHDLKQDRVVPTAAPALRAATPKPNPGPALQMEQPRRAAAEEPERSEFGGKSRLAAILRRVENDRKAPDKADTGGRGGGKTPSPPTEEREEDSSSRLQSRAERDLQRALEARR